MVHLSVAMRQMSLSIFSRRRNVTGTLQVVRVRVTERARLIVVAITTVYVVLPVLEEVFQGTCNT
jgi:hypothetical protein